MNVRYIKELLSGELLTSDAVRKQYGLIALVIGFMLIYISLGFYQEKQDRDIARLQKELTDAHYELLDLSSDYTQMTRPSAISRELERQGSSIRESNISPIEIR